LLIVSRAFIACQRSWRMIMPACDFESRYFAVRVVIHRSLRLAHVSVSSSGGGVTGLSSSPPSAIIAERPAGLRSIGTVISRADSVRS
jgi:hypothetical protein